MKRFFVRNDAVITLFALLLLSVFSFACHDKGSGESENYFDVEQAEQVLELAAAQYKGMMQLVPEDRMPRTFEEDSLFTSGIWWWTSGFYPGTLWYLYESSGDKVLGAEARKRTLMLDTLKHRKNDHDVGFQLYCSYGNALRITGDSMLYARPLELGARSLASRFSERVGSLKSWDWGAEKYQWMFPVIIDNMMNLELLLWAAENQGDTSLRKVAVQHANTTMNNHYREDYSCYHVVDYHPETGEVSRKFTHQGYHDESDWSRGHAWGVYGFTMMYRETGLSHYLNHAVQAALFMLDHPTMPEDGVPYWDYDAPDIPDALRDASAAAVLSSALLELSAFVDADLQVRFFDAAEKMLATLSSSNYLADNGQNGYFILKHSVGNKGGNSEVDVPLSYADYYFVEALLRYIHLKS